MRYIAHESDVAELPHGLCLGRLLRLAPVHPVRNIHCDVCENLFVEFLLAPLK